MADFNSGDSSATEANDTFFSSSSATRASNSFFSNVQPLTPEQAQQFANLQQHQQQQQQSSIRTRNQNNSQRGGAGAGAATGSLIPDNRNSSGSGGRSSASPSLGRSRRRDLMTPERCMSRVYWQILLWAPFFALFLHRQAVIADATHDLVNMPNVITAILVLVPTLSYNEYKDGFRIQTYAIALGVGMAWASVRQELEDLRLVRFLVVVTFGFASATLRHYRDVKRITSRFVMALTQPNHLIAAQQQQQQQQEDENQYPQQQPLPPDPGLVLNIWNYIERNVGIAPFFLAGECLCVLLKKEGGVTQLLDSAVGTAMLLSSPFISLKVGEAVASFLPPLFSWWGGNTHHATSTKFQTIMLVLTVCLSVAILFGCVGYFLTNYIPFVWNHDQLAGAFGVIIESVFFSKFHIEEKQQRAQAREEARMGRRR